MNAILARIKDAWANLPRPVRSFVVDAVEGAVTALAIVNFALPHNTGEAVAQLTLLAGTVAAPVIAAARRDILPAIVAWWASVRASA